VAAEGVTAIVPVWNRRELISPVLRNLAAQTLAPAAVLVIDNGSTDGAAEAAEEEGARVIRMGVNAGFAPAVNRGIRECGTAWVAVVNNDVTLASDYLELLVRAAMESSAWFATGKIFAAGEDAILDGTFDVVSRAGTAWRAGHGEPDGAEFSERRPIYSAPWTAALFRTELFAKVGPLEESFQSYLEDVEFGVRCARSGCAGVYAPEAVAWHLGSSTLGRWHPTTVRLISRNQLLLVARHYPARFAWAVIAGQLLWGGVALRHGAAGAWLRGKWQGVRQWRAARSTYSPIAAQPLDGWLRQNEHLLRRSRSWYWRLYFLLAPSEAN
jgi:GT2 family glycosyltransferase